MRRFLIKLKKGRYKFIKRIKVERDELFNRFKSDLIWLVEKYHRHDGDPWLFVNSPICMFAETYVEEGKPFAKRAKNLSFVQSSMERYNVHTKKYEKELVNRIMDIVNSIQKHGYAKGKYKNKLVCVIRRKDGGYELISGKHRAAACLAVGMKRIKCNLYKDIK